jgi:hypothetical protein
MIYYSTKMARGSYTQREHMDRKWQIFSNYLNSQTQRRHAQKGLESPPEFLA